jgi:hypothetical protein
LHPDRFATGTDDDRANADFKMKELNAAWAVLREPETRQAYDAEQKTKKLTSSGKSRGVGVSPVVAGAAEVEPPVAVVASRSMWVVYGPMIALGSLLALVLLLAALAGPGEEPLGVETTERYPVGSCVVVDDDDEPSEVACDGPNTGTVQDKVNFPRPCPSGTVAIVLTNEQLSLCLAP